MNVNPLQISNQMGTKDKSDNEKRLVLKGTEQIIGVIRILLNKKLR